MQVNNDIRKASIPVQEAQFHKFGVYRMSLSDKNENPEPPLLLCDDEGFGDDYLRSGHKNGFKGAPFDLSCYFLTDLVVSGIGHLFHQGALLTSPEVMRNYWEASLPHMPIAHEATLPIREIETPCVVFAGWGQNVFGHVLMEMFPRIAITRFLIENKIPRCRYLLDVRAKIWLKNMLKISFGIEENEIEYFDPHIERVKLSKAIVPSFTTQSRLHQDNSILFDKVRDYSNAGMGGLEIPRLFVSRALLNPATAQNSGRVCVNELELCMIAASDFGFTVIAPETLPWREQIRIFSNAQIVAGMFGSALHNTVFSPAGARVGAIGAQNQMQSDIAAIRHQHCLYLNVTNLEAEHTCSVDLEMFKRFLQIITSAH